MAHLAAARPARARLVGWAASAELGRPRFGLAVAGVPYAALLTAVVLFLCIAQIGPLVVLAPAVIWLFWIDETGRGTLLLVWTLVVAPIDNVLRPILIRRGADLPMLLIFAGVIGGLISFGIIGLFVGPVMLAVTYTLVREWINDQVDVGTTRESSTSPGDGRN